MAGRPRTMVKRVRKLLERHQKLTEELCNLGRHHMPGPGEPWDFEVTGRDVDLIPPLWRTAVFEASCLDDYIDDLLCFLDLKVEKAEQSASVYGVDAEDAPDDAENAQIDAAAYNLAAAADGKQIATHRPAAGVEPTAETGDNEHGELSGDDTAKPL